MRQIPRPGEQYRHFKNKLYQIITVAKHTETGEELVIYQALYGAFSVYARPLSMFMGEVNHKKYPDVKQKYRFERVDEEVSNASEDAPELASADREPVSREPDRMTAEPQEEYAQTDEVSSDEGLGVNPRIMEFLEAETFEEKYNVLVAMRDEVTDAMIDTMAVVMDVVIPEGEIEKRYDDLKYVIRTRQQYEFANRLR
jgi:hypothetical protein